MLPDANASLSLSYIGDGFTTKRNFSDYQKAPIPHFGSGFGINISQPVYTGGPIRAASTSPVSNRGLFIIGI